MRQLNLLSPFALFLPSLINFSALRVRICIPFANHILINHNFQPGSEPGSEQLNQENQQTDRHLQRGKKMEHNAHMYDLKTIEYL